VRARRLASAWQLKMSAVLLLVRSQK